MNLLGEETSGKQLLIEFDAGYISPDYLENKKLIGESAKYNPEEDLILYAILQKYDTPNRNGRVYPKRILEREAEKYKQLIEKRTSTGECEHPDSSIISLDRISHMITEIWWDGKMLMGKMKILTSQGFKKSGIISCKGDQAAHLLLNGVTLGISSRGVGSLKREHGHNIVQDDFELVCFDLVSSPSTPGSYLLFDLKDREKYDESMEKEQLNQKSLNELSKQQSLMNKLDNFLKK